MRTVLILLLIFIQISSIFGQKNSKSIQFLVGTYTGKTSQGIYQFELDYETLSSNIVAQTKGLINPSFLAIGKNKVYTVQETNKNGAVLSIDFLNKTIAEKHLQKLSAEGDHPCHLSLSPNQKQLAVGNYTGGNFAIFNIDKNGNIEPNPQVINHLGKSVVVGRQDSPHVHSCYWQKNGKEIWVIDLGIDQLKQYKLIKGKAVFQKSVLFKSGAGPRHLSKHPNKNWFYILNELNGEVSFLKEQNSSLQISQNIAGHIALENELKSAADIHISPNGKYLYASYRANLNHIAIFEINQNTGNLKLIEITKLEGKNPRNFAIDPKGELLLAANQDSESISIYQIDPTTGKLTFSGKKIEVSMPVCIQFLN